MHAQAHLCVDMNDLPASLSDLDNSQDIVVGAHGPAPVHALHVLSDDDVDGGGDAEHGGEEEHAPGGRPFPAPKTFRETAVAAGVPARARKRVHKKFAKVTGYQQHALNTQSSYAEAIANEYNVSQLSVGTLALPSSSLGSDIPRHTQKWNCTGIETKALERVGQIITKGTRVSHRELDYVSILKFSHDDAETDLLREAYCSIECGAQVVPWLSKTFNWDGTPVKLSFGKLADLLRPVCKYFWRATPASLGVDNQKWVKLSFKEYQERGMSKEPNRGTIEMLAQQQTITYASYSAQGFLDINTIKPLLGPLFTGEDSAGVIWKMLDAAASHFNFDALEALLSVVPIIDLQFGADLDAANNRAKYFVGSKAKLANARMHESGKTNRITMIDLACFGHVLHGVVSRVFKTQQLMPRLHAIAFSGAQTTYYERLLLLADSLLDKDLDDGWFPGVVPPAEYAEHADRVAEATFLRVKYTRGRTEEESPFSHDEFDFVDAAKGLLNGALWIWFVQHFCYLPGCCNGQQRRVCKQRILSWLDRGLLRITYTRICIYIYTYLYIYM